MRPLAIAIVAALLPVFAVAQDLGLSSGSTGAAPSPILIIDSERLFAQSRLGERISTQIAEAADTLARQNREIEAQLIAEELDLTERRAELAPEEFRALAQAFDARVQALRAEQDEKERALNTRQEEERQAFLGRIAPVLGDLARERGAVAILDRRAVFLAAGRIDVTEEAIERLNEAIDLGAPDPDAAPEAGDDTMVPAPEPGFVTPGLVPNDPPADASD